MRQVTLGRSGLKVSAVGFGGIPIQRLSQDEAISVIRRALELGVNFIDTASRYGDSEEKIGAAIRGRRNGVVLASKSPERTRDGILAEVDRSRRRLGVEKVDLYQLHGVSKPDAWERASGPAGALEGLKEARERGWIDHIGFTSHSLDLSLELVEEEAFETIQFPFNLVTAGPRERLIPRARDRNLGFIVMKPLCGGMYTNANLAFKFLNSFPDLVPIPGIERAEEIEEIVGVVKSAAVLHGAEKQGAERIARELGKLFCRRCGYCMPCPEGVPVQLAMIFESLLERLPLEKLVGTRAPEIAEGVAKCVECGTCEEKCPYDLPIIETIHRNAEKARQVIAACR